MLPIGAAS